MKYIFYIILLLFIFTSSYLVIEFQKEEPPPEDIALIVNEWRCSREELNRLLETQKVDYDSSYDFINSLITKKLLIQEAKRQGIDKEERFKESVREFYEQALIKTLLDRKIASLNVQVSEKELNNYLSAMNSVVLLRIGSFNTLAEAENVTIDELKPKEIPFRELSEDIQVRLLSLKTNHKLEPLRRGKKYTVIFVEDIKNLGTPQKVSEAERHRIRERLRRIKQEIMLEEWIEELRSQASIRLNMGGNK